MQIQESMKGGGGGGGIQYVYLGGLEACYRFLCHERASGAI